MQPINEDNEPYNRARFEQEKREFEQHLDNLTDLPLSSLLDLHHFSDLQLPKCPPSRYIYGIDLLNALTCYTNIISLHHACAQCARLGIKPLVIHLYEGGDVNICNEVGLTAFECFAKCERRKNSVNEIIRELFTRVYKLEVTGLHIHPQNKRQCEIVRSRDDMQHFVNRLMSFDYDGELKRMDKQKLKDGLTLRDALRDDVELTIAAMEKLKKMLKETTNEIRFPQLWCLVRMRYNQIVTRDQWKPLVTDALKIVTRCKDLPQNCVDMIFKGLRNYDLANLLVVAFEMCLRDYKNGRKIRKNANRLSMGSVMRSPKKMMPRFL